MAHSPPSSSTGSRPPRLAGRDREQALLAEHLAAALAGRGALVLVGGEAGIGKTALAETLCAEAATRGALALVGRCYDLSETPPYGPWAEAFARAPRGDGVSPPPDLAGGAGAGSQAALFAQVRDYLAALAASRPLVLLLDDLHWADPASLDLLRVLGRQVADHPLLLLATYRSDELTRRHPLYALLPILVREARAERLDLRPLDEAGQQALVAGRYTLDPADAARLVAYLGERAEGNPFFAGELLRTLVEGGVLHQVGDGWTLGDLATVGMPPLLRQVIDARVDRLGEGTRDLLAVAAVIGQEVPPAVWQAVAGADDDALLTAVERAVVARLLAETPGGDGLRFAHALVREALYEGTIELRRRALHRRAAEALAAGPAPDPDAVAYHFRQAGDARAGEWLLRAGERAQAAYAWLSAAERFEAALALLPADAATAPGRALLLIRLARLRRYSDPRWGLAHFDEAARLAAAAGDRGLVACATFEAGLLRCLVGELRAGLAAMAAGVSAFDALGPEERADLDARGFEVGRDHGRGTLAVWLADAGRFAEALGVGAGVAAEVAGAPAVRGPLGAGYATVLNFADAFQALGEVHACLGRPAEARRAYARGRALYRRAAHHVIFAMTALHELELVALPYQADRPAVRRRLAAAGERAWARAGGALAGLPPRVVHLPVLCLEGQWAEALALAAVLRAAGHGYARYAACYLSPLAYDRGDMALARALVREMLPAGPATAPGDMNFMWTVGLLRLAAALAVDAGDLAAARTWLEAYDRWLVWSGATPGRAEGALGWAAYRRAAGDPAQGRAHAEQALTSAGEPRQPLALLAAHRLVGELDTADRRHTDAARHLDVALALADACAAPYERALTLLATAELRAATGAREAARAALAEVRALCAPLEARPALTRADALVARLDAQAAPAPAYPAGLTAREVDVLRLVAEGLTDAQVAARLFVSPRTVSTHLRAIYGKLVVDNRTAAARRAAELHLL